MLGLRSGNLYRDQLTYPLDGWVLGVELSASGHGRGCTVSEGRDNREYQRQRGYKQKVVQFEEKFREPWLIALTAVGMVDVAIATAHLASAARHC